MFLHPDRKEDKWSKSEDQKLTEICKKYKCQNWDKIAEELGIGRSPFSLCSRYYSKLCTRNYRRDKFHPEEDELLLDIIETCRIGNYIPWSKVSYYFNGRTKNQLYHRYTYYLARKNTRKLAQFTFEEDALIMALVERIGKNFSKIAELVPDRSAMQIKNRYNCYLQNPDLSYRPFSIEEDRQILLHGAENNSWGVLAKRINYPRCHLRHRFNTITKWIANNPDKDLLEMPRREASRPNDNELNAKFEQLKKVADTLKRLDHVPTLEDVKDVMVDKRLCSKKPHTFLKNSVHQQLINYFRTSYKISRAYSFITDISTEKDAMIINDILQLLGADLELPSLGDIEKDGSIDRMDVFFLNHIINKRSESSFLPQESIKFSLPPNIGTVVGLRNMIMAMSISKSKPVMGNAINYNDLIIEELRGFSEAEKTQTLKERKKFRQRVYSVFRWPSLMSLTDVCDIQSPSTEVVEETVIKRKKGRPRKNNITMNIKIKKMLAAKAKKRMEQTNKTVLENNYISVKGFAREDSVNDMDIINLSKDCTTSVNINVGASTSGSGSASVPNILSEDFCVRKTKNARTYKRKRNVENYDKPDICVKKATNALTYKRNKTEQVDECKPVVTVCILKNELSTCVKEQEMI